MSDFGLFEAELDASNAPERRARTASMQLANAIDEVRDRYGDFLMTASGKDEFEDRWHYSKRDIREAVESAGAFPNTGTMNRVRQALKREFSATLGDDNAEDPTKKPKDGDGPKKDRTINDSQYKKVKDGDKTVGDEVKTNTGDGSDAEGRDPSSTTGKQDDPRDTDKFRGKSSSYRTAEDFEGDLHPDGNFEAYLDSVDEGGPEKVQRNFGTGGDTGEDRGRNAKRAALELYSDWAEGNGMRVASLNTLAHYADTGIGDNTYHLIANYVLASDDCECDDDDEDDSSDSDSSDGPPPPSHDESDSDSESDSSGDSDSEDDSDDESDSEDSGDDSVPFGDDGGEVPADDTGGEDSPAGPPSDDAGDEGFAGPPEGPTGLDDDGGDPAAVGDPATDDPGMGGDVYPDAAGPGDDFSIPDAPPQLSPEEQGMIPEGDDQGDQSIPPELIDDILGLPPGTVEQLVMQEIGGGGGDPGGPPPPPEEDPSARLARQLFAEFTGADWHSKSPKGEAAGKPQTNWDSTNGGVSKGKNPITPKASRRRVAAEDADPAAGGDAVGAPTAEESAAPAASPSQPGPDDGALLDQASQAVTQLVDTKTQQFQQVMDPLQQALQAIQFAQSVDQAANPLDVTPPEGTVDVGPGAVQPPADPAAAGGAPAPAAPPQQQTAALQRHAFKIASRHDLSERGYHMLLAAMSNKHYRHVAEAIAPLRDPQEKMALASSLVDMFKADNVRFNPQSFLASAGIGDGGQHLAGNPADRAGDRWADGKDRASKDAEDYDTDPDNWEEREAHRLGLTASRRPFAEGGRRTAGETLKPATGGNTMDVFEAPGAGEQPEFTDNNKLTDLPKMKGPKIGSGVVDKYQHYKQQQEKAGLGIGGDAEVESFFNSSGKGYGDIARNKVHSVEGITPHPKTAGFFTPKVAGWNWDDHLNGYVTNARREFTCTTHDCHEPIPTPSYTNCKCGKIWNTYAIGTSNHLASGDADMYIAREIPVRANVVMANRHLAGEDGFNESGDGEYQDYPEDVEFFSDDELENAPTPHAPGETDMDTRRSAGLYRSATEYPDDHNVVTRNGEKFCSACDAMLWDPNVHHCPEKQARRRQADWTKFDDDDNAGYNDGPSGPPSTEAKPIRDDWAKVDGKGRYAPSTFAK